MGTHQPNNEQASRRSNKDGKKYVKHQESGQNNEYMGKRKIKVTDVIEQVKSEDGRGPRQGTSAGYKIPYVLRVSPHGNHTSGNGLEEDRRDVGETNKMTTGRVPSGRG